MGAELRKILNPVRDRRVINSPELSESMNTLIVNPITFGYGALGGNYSLHSQ